MGVKAWCLHQWLLFRVALQFLTRWPVASFPRFDVAWLSESLRYFPLVGVWVAVVLWCVWYLLALVLPHPVALALMMGAGLMLTGGFHEDGWADACDGMGGASEPERVLIIMKDSRVGAFGAMGLIWMLLSKWTALSYFGPAPVMLLALVSAHALSRLSATALIVRLAHVGDAAHSKTKPLGNQMTPRQWQVSAVMTALCLSLCMGVVVLIPGALNGQFLQVLSGLALAVVVSLALASACGAYFRKRIDGYTGDCLGATQQLCELSIYLVWLALLAPARWA